MSDCSNHKKEVAGISDMKDLANRIGDLHYENLTELLRELSKKLKKDGRKDMGNGKIQLGNQLKETAIHLTRASHNMNNAWQISKPFMEDRTTLK